MSCYKNHGHIIVVDPEKRVEPTPYRVIVGRAHIAVTEDPVKAARMAVEFLDGSDGADDTDAFAFVMPEAEYRKHVTRHTLTGEHALTRLVNELKKLQTIAVNNE